MIVSWTYQKQTNIDFILSLTNLYIVERHIENTIVSGF